MQAVVTYYHCIIFLLPLTGNSMCNGLFASQKLPGFFIHPKNYNLHKRQYLLHHELLFMPQLCRIYFPCIGLKFLVIQGKQILQTIGLHAASEIFIIWLAYDLSFLHARVRSQMSRTRLKVKMLVLSCTCLYGPCRDKTCLWVL